MTLEYKFLCFTFSCPFPELLWALHPGSQGSGDQGLQDGGWRPRRRRKPHRLQNLCPHYRGKGRMDEQHQVNEAETPSVLQTLSVMISWRCQMFMFLIPAEPPSVRTHFMRCLPLGRRRSPPWRGFRGFSLYLTELAWTWHPWSCHRAIQLLELLLCHLQCWQPVRCLLLKALSAF